MSKKKKVAFLLEIFFHAETFNPRNFHERTKLFRINVVFEIRLVTNNHVSHLICNDYTTIAIGRTQPSNKSFLVVPIRAIFLTILYFLRLYFPDFYVARRCYLFHFYAFHHYNVRIFRFDAICFGLVNSSL